MKKWYSIAVAVCLITSSIQVKAENREPREVQVLTSNTITEISMEDFDMIAKVVMAEAGNQTWEAQWYVACVILNRVESDQFPDTIKDVIFQENPKQFCCVWDGGYKKAVPIDSVYEAVGYALEEDRIPTDVLFFTSNGYLKGTEPYEKIGDMYYSR